MGSKAMGSKATRQPLLHLLFIALSLLFVVPFLLIVSVSLSNDQDIAEFGYRLLPARIDLSAYTWVFRDLSTVLRAYGVTAFQAVAGTTLGVLAMALAGYVLSRTDYAWRRIVMFVIFFTLVFSGGLVPTYIIVTRWYHLGNTLWVYIFPVLVNAFFVIIIRTFFTQLPEEVFESARIDGAREITICLQGSAADVDTRPGGHSVPVLPGQMGRMVQHVALYTGQGTLHPAVSAATDTAGVRLRARDGRTVVGDGVLSADRGNAA